MAGGKIVEMIKRSARSTFSKRVLSGIGLFGGFFDAKFPEMKNPVLVSSMDGVGTKLRIAFLMDRHETVGQDLVNHCVNDIAVGGATPLFFLDYFATGRLRPQVAQQVIDGMARACRENGCALIGGETAEMPGFYAENEYDLAGTVVGIVEKNRIINGKKIVEGDLLIGLPSNGLHTNGYSLARKVLFERYDVDDILNELGLPLGEILLVIHRSYLKAMIEVRKIPGIHGISHITGGGIEGNTVRLLPHGMAIAIDWKSWNRPPIFNVIQQVGNVPESEMRRTFNLGVGLVFIVSKKKVEQVLQSLRRIGEEPLIIGEIRKADRKSRRR